MNDRENTLCLLIMIKNGESKIEETINNIKEYIGYYVILDTGSTDNSISIMKDCLKNKNGYIYEEPFEGFDKSRNKLIELAEKLPHNCKYFIMLDDTYILKNQQKLLDFLNKPINKNFDAFNIPIITKNQCEKNVYYSTRIWKTASGVRYVDPIHEYPDVKGLIYSIDIKTSYLLDNVDNYMRKRSIKRREYDITILKKMHEERPKYTRTIRYLIDYHFNEMNKKECLEYCNKMINLIYTEKEEFLVQTSQKDFYDCCIKIILLLTRFYGKTVNDILKYIELANTIDPTRVEHIYYYACLLERIEKYGEMNILLNKIKDSRLPSDVKSLVNIQVDMKMYEENIPYKYIMSNIYLRKNKIALEFLKEKLEDDPANILFLNLYDNINIIPGNIEVTKYPYKVLVFVLDYSYCNVDDKIYDYLDNITKRGWNIVLFTNYKKDIDNEKIKVKELDELYPFIKDTYIDVLVSFNTTRYALYLENIEKVYIWEYETHSIQDDIFTHHKKIFKYFICQTNKNKEKLIEKYNIDENLVKTLYIPYDIQYDKTSNENITKIKNKFTVFYAYKNIENKKYVDSFLSKIENITIEYICDDENKENKENIISILDKDKIINSLRTSEYYISICKYTDNQDPLIRNAMYLNCIPITEDGDEIKRINLILQNDSIKQNILEKIKKDIDNYSIKEFSKKISTIFL
jgi:hypothetical protein